MGPQRHRVVVLACLAGMLACGEPSSSPPVAPTATAALDVPPLSPSKATAAQPIARQPPPPSTTGEDDESPLPGNAAVAEATFQEAKRELAANNLVGARELFLRSYRMDPAAGTLLNLALCEEKLGLRAQAIRHYQAAYDDSLQNGRTDRAALAKDRLDRLKNQP